jgi:hypothetical protein
MPLYQTTTLDQLTQYIGGILDDPTLRYWTAQEIKSGIWEGLRLWGALTNFWRTRQAFNLDPTQNNPFYDLSVVMPVLRSRTWILNQMVQEIQSMLLEAPSGIAGTGMSGQVGVDDITNSIQKARNRFVVDTRFPIAYHLPFSSTPPTDGVVTFGQDSVYTHRVSWQDSSSLAWSNVWRQDGWAFDKSKPFWPTQPGMPRAFSEAELSPLKLQLFPPPINEGTIDALTVDSLQMKLDDPNALFNIPDDWVHAIKYAALSNILSSGQIFDELRADYAEQRYQQYVQFARDAHSLIRMTSQGLPLNVDTMDNLDAGYPFWRNQVGSPLVVGEMYDMIGIYPMPDQPYGLTADVVQVAPIPLFGSDFIQLGSEDIDHLADYVQHILLFKCGGLEFKSTMAQYQSFMKAVAGRDAINQANVMDFDAMFGQSQKEWAQRPDFRETANA